MMQRSNPLITFFFCLSFSLFITVVNNSAYAYPENTVEEQGAATDRIYGKVSDVIDVAGYTYAEVDDGKSKVWVAGPVTPLKIGDMIAFTTDMPMENYHSQSLDRDFAIIYFAERFITDKVAPETKTEPAASPHDQLKQGLAAKPVIGINKVEGGNTIAEIYAQKQQLNGKTIRVRGQVTKVTNKVMGKNWLHIMDSSTPEDLTVTTQSTVDIDDVVVIEGKLGLDRDFSYGYIYPVILEDAKIVE